MKLFRKAFYVLYLIFLKNTPEDWRPYQLFFPFLRRIFVQFYLMECGKKLRVKHGAEISPDCTIGENSDLGTRCIIQANVTIGSNVIMGPDVKIYSRNHTFDDLDIPIQMQGKRSKPVKIGDDVWIGSNVVILPGVSIGNHSILAAGSIVTKDVRNGVIVGGNPAIFIRER